MHPRAYIDTRLRVSQSACGNAHGETPFSLPRYFGAFVTSSHCGLQTTAVPPSTLRSTRPQPIPQAQRAGTAWCLKHLRSLALSPAETRTDRKSTRLNSSHQIISSAVFCFKKKTTHT